MSDTNTRTLPSADPEATQTPVRTMKAIVRDRYGSADVLHLRDIEVPRVGDEAVLVRVRAAGLDRGAWHIMAGLPYLIRVAGFGLRRPKTAGLGSEFAGVVEAVGANVTGWRPGEAVFGTSSAAFAEYAAGATGPADADAGEPELRAGRGRSRLAVTALQALRDRGRVAIRSARADHRCIWRRRHLRRPDRQDPRSERHRRLQHPKVDLVRSLGADHVIDYTHADITDDGRRYDVVLDIGGNRPLSQLRRVLTGEARWSSSAAKAAIAGQEASPPTRRDGAVALRAPALGNLHRQVEQHRPRRADSTDRGRTRSRPVSNGSSGWSRFLRRSATSPTGACEARS